MPELEAVINDGYAFSQAPETLLVDVGHEVPLHALNLGQDPGYLLGCSVLLLIGIVRA